MDAMSTEGINRPHKQRKFPNTRHTTANMTPICVNPLTTVMSHFSNHRQLDCLFNCLFNLTTKKTSKLHITGPLWGESTGDWQIARNHESIPISKHFVTTSMAPITPGSYFNIKDCLFRYRDACYKDKIVVSPSCIYHGNSYVVKTAYLYWNKLPLLYYVTPTIT